MLKSNRSWSFINSFILVFFCLNLHGSDWLWEEVKAVVWKAVKIFDGPIENGGSGFNGQWTTSDSEPSWNLSFKRMKRTLPSLATQQVGWKLGPLGTTGTFFWHQRLHHSQNTTANSLLGAHSKAASLDKPPSFKKKRKKSNGLPLFFVCLWMRKTWEWNFRSHDSKIVWEKLKKPKRTKVVWS